MNTSRYVGLAAAFLLSLSIPAFAQCAGGQQLTAFSGKPITLANDTLFFKSAVVKLDIDGSPNAYGTLDQGTENICNGLGPLRPPACRGRIRGACYTACQQAFRDWRQSGAQPAALPDYMCSIGLGGSSCGRPEVRLQAAPRESWFVSETSLKTAPPAGTPLATWRRSQEAQLDSTRVSYFVIPGRFVNAPWQAKFGDIGVIIKGPQGTAIPFVVGDGGGRLDEGSAKLLAQLRGVAELPTRQKRNALGQMVQRLEGELRGDFRVAIFRHTSVTHPDSASVLAKSSGELADWITTKAQEKLAAIGGAAAVHACAR